MRLHEVKKNFVGKTRGRRMAPQIASHHIRKNEYKSTRLRKRILALIFITMIVLGASAAIVWGPFLKVRSLEISGLNTRVAEAQVNGLNYLHAVQLWRFLPQDNLLSLHEKGLSEYLENQFPEIWRVREVKRVWPDKVTVTVEARRATFLVSMAGTERVLGQDGKPLQEFSAGGTDLVSPVGLSRLVLPNSEFEEVLQDESVFESLMQIRDGLALGGIVRISSFKLLPVVVQYTELLQPGSTQTAQPVSFRTEPRLSGDVAVKVTLSEAHNNREMYILVSLDGVDRNHLAKQVQWVAGHFTDRMEKAVYLDFRFAGRGYLCLENTPCAANKPWLIPEDKL